MKIKEASRQLEEIHNKFGDLEIVGGCLLDDTPLTNICVINKDGMEIFPKDPNNVGIGDVEGVFLTSCQP